MKSNRLLPLAAFALAFASMMYSSAALAAQSVPSERSKTAPVLVASRWRSEAYPASLVTRMHYREIPAADILKVQQNNAIDRAKATQIGIGRFASTHGVERTLPALKWIALSDGGSVARIEIRSPVALGMRVGLQVGNLDPRAQFQFAGSDAASRIVATMTAKEMQELADAQGIFWTPSTDGETQVMEIYLPAQVPRNAIRLGAPRISHLLASSSTNFKIIEKSGYGESGVCNVNTACRVAELGSTYVSAKNAVAHMLYTYPNGSGFICTGTLLADTVTATQIPYFYTAHHCFAGGVSGVPATTYPTGFQAVANTLNTYWKYETAACANSPSQPASTQLVGGSDYLYSDPNTDGMFLRLKDAPPAGSEFSGWDSSVLPASSAILGIHHPSGDAKKVSSGSQISQTSYRNYVGWLSGTTEGGSSGSAIFTATADGYRLRGGLYGGSASCDNTGSLADTGNRDQYSRFDVVFANISQWLSPVSTSPIRMNGSHPLIHSGSAIQAASPPAASAVPKTPTSKPMQRGIRPDRFER